MSTLFNRKTAQYGSTFLNFTNKTCTVIGYLTLGLFAYKTTKFIYHMVRRPKDLSEYGEWSVVTGGTDGIGKAIAFELARKGQNILLLGRNLTKLTNVSNQISMKYTNIQVEYVEIDLSMYGNSIQSQNRYLDAIYSKNVGILVNNAAVCYDAAEAEYFTNVPLDTVKDIIDVNINGLCVLTHYTIKYFLQKEMKASTKRRGTIVNISSGTSLIPSSFMTVYGSSKVFLNRFSADINNEYISKGISCQSQIVGQVRTKMVPALKKKSFFVTEPDIYAKYAVKHIGYSGIVAPFIPHAMLFYAIDLLPQIMLDSLIDWMFQMYFKVQYLGN
eukprot:359918_1